MRQAEKVLREREAKERMVREARIRTARIEAAQLRVARDTSVKPVVMRGNVYSKPATARPVAKTRRPIERAVVSRPMITREIPAERVAEKPAPKKEEIVEDFLAPVEAFDGLEAKKRSRFSQKNSRASEKSLSDDELEKISFGDDFEEPKQKSAGRRVRTREAEIEDAEEVSRRGGRKTLRKSELKEARRMPERDEFEEEPKKKKSKFWKWFWRIFILLVIGGVAFGFAWSNGLISKITGGQSGIFDVISTVFNPDVELKKGSNGRTNILVFGTSGYEMDGSGHDGAQLTDSIMLVSFEKETSDVVMVNLPRDLYVGNTCTATGKVNEVYWCANTDDKNEEAGAKALQDTVTRILGVETQYYVHVNWGALVQVVDALGGVTVTLDEDIADSWTKTYIHAGEAVTLDGEQALGLARARHGTEQGDFSRGASQQKLLIALVSRVLEQHIDVGQALGLVNAVGDNLRTNFSIEEIKSMVHLVADVDLANMRQVALTSTDGTKNYLGFSYMPVGGVDVSYVVPTAGTSNYVAIQKLIAQEFSTDLATREKANILVLNGSGVSGAAAKERDTLEDNGFIVGKIGDAPEGEYPTKYYLYDITAKCPGTLASLQKRYEVTASETETLPEGIESTGFDFVLILGTREEE